ncbi:hypothetical protein F4778DRAFT_745662 [Xylariomycetidae sp. FL2044]|nr:hypothetical protein F4778DRAFT_745662 [Xylariomycetidae sp. FL2044]
MATAPTKPATHHIKRRPVAPSYLGPTYDAPPAYDGVEDLLDGYYEPPAQRPLNSMTSDKNLSVSHLEPSIRPSSSHAPPTGESRDGPKLRARPSMPAIAQPSYMPNLNTAGLIVMDQTPLPSHPPISPPASSEAIIDPSAPVAETTAPTRSVWKAAVDETIYFAGGLISHPFENNKYYSILRHTPGLVFYRGPSTSITISIFAKEPLPSERTFWLQRRGYSGNMGMNASAFFGTTGEWIDVTPTSQAVVTDIPESDERAWQRDIKKFLKKASKGKPLCKHVIRETCIIRIPAVASDGYMRIVMCGGPSAKKTLCPSPVFRIASTSSDVSVLRGASLSTVPLEAGLRVASVIGTQYVNRYLGPAKAIAQSRVAKVMKYEPGFVKKTNNTGQVALVKSVVKEQVSSMERGFNPNRDVSYNKLHDEEGIPVEVVGSDEGPQKPFPLSIDGKIVQGTGRSREETGIPTANLTGVSDDLLKRLGGVYMGWASVQPKKELAHIPTEWHEAIIRIGPCPYAAPLVVPKNEASVHVIHDFDGETFVGAKLKVVIMGYLRPIPPRSPPGFSPDQAALIARDVNITLASLARPDWQIETTLQRTKTEKSQRTMSDRYIEARSQMQKRADSLPAHWAGIRTAGAERQDLARGRGGLYIRR